jgi:hypothetical protein
MKKIGGLLIVLGVLFAFFALAMDTTVSTNTFGIDKVNNLGKMNQQQNFVMGALTLCIMGSILFVGGTLEEKLDIAKTGSRYEIGNPQKLTSDKSDDIHLTPAHKELKSKYERSEISLEEYSREWNKLS